ncbi:unnamed protein product [Dibothriocephalus latus]|uniref:Methyltransferase domain-containing protein n=1 Tax=Dibothriocephalus latus TaxID=60516 RepID=A0A3P7M1M3_DIBLA|nr:unnamed protein product [Dibothriocephalus latus]
MIPTPCTDLLTQPQFSDVYPPSEDSFLFLDALEKDITFLTDHLKPAVVMEIGSGSGVISTFLSKLLRTPTMFIGVDISEKSRTGDMKPGKLSPRGVLYLLLLRENQPSEVHELVRESSTGRLFKVVCLMNRTCHNENLAVYRYYDPTVHIQMPEI